MNIAGELKALTKPGLRVLAMRCLLWRTLHIPVFIIVIPLFIVHQIGLGAEWIAYRVGALARLADGKMRAEYEYAAKVRKAQKDTGEGG